MRIRADNNEGEGAWSSWVTQSTNKADNALPAFAANAPTQLYVVENGPSNQEPVREDSATGAVVTLQADDSVDGDTVTHRLDGPGANRFNINNNGQITTRSKLNHEDSECGYTTADDSCSYRVRVKASDRNGGSVFHSLTINVTDSDEPPDAPGAPRVTATAGSGWSLEVTWSEPRNTGPPITGYQIRYRKSGEADLATMALRQ